MYKYNLFYHKHAPTVRFTKAWILATQVSVAQSASALDC